MHVTLRTTEQEGQLAESWVKLEDYTFYIQRGNKAGNFHKWGLLGDNLALEKAHFVLQMVGHKAGSNLDA